MKKFLIFLLTGRIKKGGFALGLTALVLLAPCAHSKSPDILFPTVDELSGGRNHWVQSILPVAEPEEAGGCTIYSATYAYFAKDVKPLFDIPRKNIYSINIRFHVCPGTKEAAALYDRFSKVGDEEHKRLMSMGEKSLLYVQPNERNQLMGNYYLTALYRYVVMQVHADDGFVLMDIGDLVSKRLSSFLDMDGALTNGITLSVNKENHAVKNEFITFSGNDVSGIDINGTVYDSAGMRVKGAKVTVLETGDYVYTDDKGNFGFYLGDGDDGGEVTIYRSITVSDAYTAVNTGYYRVDIAYKTQNRIGQDAWRLEVAPDGSVTGVSYNIADEKQLPLTGTASKDSIEIIRNCGTSFMGECRQYFKATADEYGLFAGTWSGTGGGGEWVLLPGTYSRKSTNVTLEEADLVMEISGLTEKKADKNEEWIVSGAKEKLITIKPKKARHDDFYVSDVNLVLDITGVIENKTKNNAGKPGEISDKAVYIYGINANNSKKALASTPELPLSGGSAQGVINITDIYRTAAYPKYRLGFLKSTDEISAKVRPSVEMVFAVSGRKVDAPGALKVRYETSAADDIAGSGKVIKPDNSPDIMLSLDIASYGSILKGVEVLAVGESRQWNTDTAQFHPGIAVLNKAKAVVNSVDGTIKYPLQQLNERLYLHMTRGSTDMNKIKSFEVTLILDNGRVTVPVKAVDKK